MIAQDIINRVRQNPLNDFDPVNPTVFLNWTLDELCQYLNESVNEVCKETLCLTDSDTPLCCVEYVGIGNWFAQGTNAATLKTISVFQYWNSQLLLPFAITDNIAITACSAQPISTFYLYLISADGNGNVTVTQGTGGATQYDALLPDCPVGNTPIGMFMVATDSTHTFTSGTNSLNGTGITATFFSTLNTIQTDISVIRVTMGMLDNSDIPLTVKDVYWMNANIPGWRRSDSGVPRFLVQGQKTDQYTIWPPAQYPDRLVLTVKRRPLIPITSDNYTTVSPELREQYHNRLYNGIAEKAYQKQGVDTFDSDKFVNYSARWKLDIEYVKREEIRLNQGSETNYLSGACL